jgi:DNA-binding GntR family transcriptional regulator
MSKDSSKIGSARASAVYRALRHAIIEQALEPGAKLPEDAIGERFGVSRTLVRYALGQLAAEGLVEMRRNRGAAVAKPSWDEARDIFDVRRGLERLVVTRLSGQLTREQIVRLNQHVDSEEAAQGKNEPLSIRLAGEFHILLAEMTGSALLTRYVSEVSSRSGLILALYGRPHSSECAVSEHRAVIKALVKGDTAAAIDVMDRHLEAVADRALIQTTTQKRRELRDVLDAYVSVAQAGKPPASTRSKRANGRDGR